MYAVKVEGQPASEAEGPETGPHLTPGTIPSPQAVRALKQLATVVEAKLIKHKKDIISE